MLLKPQGAVSQYSGALCELALIYRTGRKGLTSASIRVKIVSGGSIPPVRAHTRHNAESVVIRRLGPDRLRGRAVEASGRLRECPVGRADIRGRHPAGSPPTSDG